MGSRSVLINLLGEGGGASRALRGVGDDADRAARRVDGLDESNRRASEGGNIFTRSMEQMAPAAGRAAASIGMVAAQVGTVVPAAAGLAATLVQIAPAAAVAATGIAAAGLAAGALKIGLAGVGDAAKAALDPSNPEAYAKALAKLSPNARAFVEQIHQLSPAFAGIKTAVQDTLFQGLDKSFANAARTTLPVFREGLVGAAQALNGMGKNLLSTIQGLGKSGTLKTLFSGATEGLGNLTKIPAQLVKGFAQVGAAAAPTFAKMTAGIGGFATKASDALSGAFKSGAMTKAIDVAVGLLRQLGQVAVNVFKIVGNIFGAAQASGGGFVGTLQKITGALAEVSGNPAFQAGLRAIFETMSQLATTAAPLLAQALLAIAPIFTALGPPLQTVIQALGQALQPVIAALGPVLVAAAQAFGALIIALAPLLPVIGQIIAAVLPVLIPVFRLLATVFTALTPVIATVAQALTTYLVPVINTVVGVVTKVVGWIQSAAQQAFPALASAASGAWSVIKGAVSVAWDVIRPILTSLASFFTDKVVPAAETLANDMDLAFTAIKKTVKDAWDAIKGWLTEFKTFLDTTIGPAIEGLKEGIQGIGDKAKGLPDVLSGINGIQGGKAPAGGGGGADIGNAFTIMFNRIRTEFTTFTGWANTAWGGFLDGIGGATKTFAGHVQRDWSAPFNKIIEYNAYFFALLTAVATKGIQEFVRGMLSPWPGLQAKWNQATQGIPKAATQMVFNTIQAIGKLPGLISGIAARTWDSLPRTLSGSAAAVSQKLAALKAGIIRAFAGAPGWLRAAGQAIIDGLIAGVNGKVGGLLSRLASIAGSVKSIFAGVLKSHSPSRVMIDIGHDVMDGLDIGLTENAQKVYGTVGKIASKLGDLIDAGAKKALEDAHGTIDGITRDMVKGLRGTADQIDAATKKIAAAIRSSFRAGAIDAGQRDGLLDYLANTNKKLKQLTKERQEVLDKIKQVQDYAKQLTQSVLNYASIVNIKGEGDAAPTGGQLVAGLQARLATIREFGANIKKLAGAGLSKALLGQILDAGIDGGAAIAAELANGPSSIITALNTAQTQITKIAKGIGLDGADALFGSGKAMGDAFLKGLKSLEKALVDSMEELVAKLLKALGGGVDKAKGKLAELAETSKQAAQLAELVVTSTAKAAAYQPPQPKAPGPAPAAPQVPYIPAPKTGGGQKAVTVHIGGVTVKDKPDADMLMNLVEYRVRSAVF